MDARMGEVYWATFGLSADRVEDEGCPERGISGGAAADISGHPLLAAGLGLATYPDLCAELGLSPEACFPDAEPHAQDVALLAALDLAAGAPWLDAAAAQPEYVRDEVAKIQR
jgi:tRNA A37 threonylcarbamoyladenosine modification protein TsaB